LKNQRVFVEALKAAAAGARTDRLPLSLLRLEIDHVDQLYSALEPASFHELLAGLAGTLRLVSRD
jgi:hypothetical protein